MVPKTVGRLRTLFGDGRSTVLVAIASGWFISMGVRMSYPVLVPHIRRAFQLDLAGIGTLLTVMWVAYAVGQLPGGILADRIGEGTVMAASALLSAGTMLLVVSAGTSAVLFVATAMFGFATALYAVARFTALTHVYPENLGKAVGVTMAAGDAGQAALPPVAALLAGLYFWELGFASTIPLFLAAAILLWVTLPGRTGDPVTLEGGSLGARISEVRSGLSRPTVLYGTAIMALGTAIWQTFTGFYPTYLIEVKGMSSTLASGLFALFFVVGMIIKPGAGASYDLVGVRRSLAVVVGTIALSLTALPFAEGIVPLVALTVVASSILGYGAITLSYLTEALPANVQNTGLGSLRTTYTLLGSVSPLLFGAAAERGYFDELFFVLAGIAVIMLLLTTRLPALQPNSGRRE